MEDLAELNGKREEAYRRALYNVCRLDSDLADNRSMSMAAKIRLQAERNADRLMHDERSWITKRIEKLKQGKF